MFYALSKSERGLEYLFNLHNDSILNEQLDVERPKFVWTQVIFSYSIIVKD